MSSIEPQPTILIREEEDTMGEEVVTTADHQPSPLVPQYPPIMDDSGTTTTTIPPASPLLLHNSLFPIITTPTIVDVTTTATTLWDCEDVGNDSVPSRMSSAYYVLPSAATDHRHHRREREVSCMGSSSGSSTGQSRSGLRLAKKERRQKAKDGRGDDAFAGDDESCDDEGMSEIVVNSTRHTTNNYNEDMSDNAWATPMLSSTTSVPSSVSTSSKRSDLRRGKRDLMRSWLDTPSLGELGQRPSDRSPTPTGLPFPAITIDCQNDDGGVYIFSPTTDPLTNYAADPSISLSGLLVSISQRSPITSMSLDDSTTTPTESCSSMSVRHSRPRDTIRSIQAMRGSASTSSSMIPPHTTSPHRPTLSLPYMAVCEPRRHLSALPLPPDDDQEDISRTASFRRPHPPQVSFMSSANLYPNNPSKKAQQQHQVQLASTNQDTLIKTFVDDGPLSDTTLPSDGLTTTGLFPATATASLSLHPGPKPRNVVTFNADAYNLDTWDADVMGLFALPTEGAPSVALMRGTPSSMRADMSSSMDPSSQLMSWSSSRPILSQDVDDCCQSSVSVLSSYFDQSRPKPGALDADPLTVSHDQPQNVKIDVYRYQYAMSGSGGIDLEEGGLLSSLCEASSPFNSPLQRLTRNPGSPLDGGITSFSLLLSPTITTINTQSNVPPNTTDEHHHHHHQAVRRDYLLDISGVHVDSNATSILLKREVNSKDGGSGSMTMSRPSGSYNPSKACRGGGGASSTSFSDIISKFVAVDTLVHQATSYTEQLANPVSDAGQIKRGSQDRWVNQQNTTD